MVKSTPSTSQIKFTKHHSIVIVIVVIIAALLFSMVYISSRQTGEVQNTMNDAAYQSMETLMSTLASNISSSFAADQEYMSSLASTITSIEDASDWISTVNLNSSIIQNIYFSTVDSEIAYGKNGKTINLSDYVFRAHKNGQVRSGTYMSGFGNYVYLMRTPIEVDNEVIGYLYGEFAMSRFYNDLPTSVTDFNEISLMEADTLRYIQIPAHSGAGTHISIDSFSNYLDDAALAEKIVGEIKQAIKDRNYYMRMLTFQYAANNVKTSEEYVVFLWPIDDGEYYLSGFCKVDYLQRERISVTHTVKLMVVMLLGISVVTLALLVAIMGVIITDSRRRGAAQQKHNEELDEALSIAKVANQSKSNFLSNMSHDIRTPMNAIIGYTTLIGKEAEDPQKVREYTKKITGAGDYLLGLINDVLDMSKIESGKTTLTISQFRIREMVNEVESIMRMQANEKHQIFTVTVEDIEHDSVMGDKLRVRQIILNLISNALKYTPNGGKIDFIVSGIHQAKANIQKVRIVVKDTGYGMDEEYIKTIFDPFIRLNNTMTGKIQGTGLGLAITKNIVNLMGGTITVNSELNKGSTFTVEIELPVASDEEEVTNTVSASEKIENTLNGLHILAAEDNELNAEILTELLAIEGVTCKVCEDGEKLVSEFEQAAPGTYDLILMDIQMPNMNGYEAAKAIRAGEHPEAKTIPIVAMTANAFAEDVMDALQAGMDAHIAKPVDMEKMKLTFSKVLKNEKEG